MAEYKHMLECFLCRREFQFGPHVYDGRRIPEWDVMFCRICDGANWDGLVIENHPRLAAYLKSKGIPIRLNAKGWLDIPGARRF